MQRHTLFSLTLTAILALAFLAPVFGTGIREVPRGGSEATLDSLLPLDPEVEIGRLANGLTYYIDENPEPNNRAYLRLVVNAGSILETDAQQGLAHFAEHMAFNGTSEFPGNELIAFLETLGMQFGPDVNAYTSFDETVYMLQLPTDDTEKLETGFRVLQQWASEITFAPEEIEKERGVVLEEWRLGRGAQQRMRDEQFPVLFKDSRYAERLPIGKPEIIRNFDRETLVEYYEDWYRPDLMAVIAVGDFDAERVRSLIRTNFAGLETPADARTRQVYEVPSHDETLYAPASDPEAQYTTVSIYNKKDAESLRTVGDYRNLLINRLFTRMLNARFSEITNRPDSPIRRARVGSTRLVRTEGVNYLTGVVKDREILAGLQALVTEARRAKQFGFTDSELTRAKEELRREYEDRHSERNKTSSERFVGEYTEHFLAGTAAPGIEYELELVKEHLPGITLEEVNEQAEGYLKDDNRAVLVSAVEKSADPIPGEEALASTLREAEQTAVEPYVDEVPDEPLVSRMPEAGSIVSEKSYSELNVTEWELSNGARVVLKPTDFKNNEVLFTAFGPGGSSRASLEAYPSASVAGSVVQEMGVAGFSSTDLEKVLSGKTVRVRPFVDELQVGLSGRSAASDVETLFQLIRLYVTQPRKDENAFESWRQSMETVVQNRREQPRQVFSDRVSRILSQNHPRRRPLTSEFLSEVDLDETLDFYDSQFGDTSDFTFVFVGNIDVEQFRTLARRYIASLPAEPDTEQFADVGVTRPEGVVKETVSSGIAPQSLVGIVFHGSYDWNPAANYRIRALAQFLQIRLREVLREEQSGTYAQFVRSELSRYPDERYRLDIYFGTSPERAEELSRTALDIVRKLRRTAPDTEYAERVRSSQLTDYETALESNRFWLRNLEDIYWNDISPGTILEYPEHVEELTAADFKQAAADYLSLDRYVQVILYPEDQTNDGQ